MSSLDFTATDREQLAVRGISVEEAERQLELLRHPPPKARLDRPCVVGDGVIVLSASEQDEALSRGRGVVSAGRVTKFVPASGAATRMFQGLIAAASGSARPSSSDAGALFFSRLDAFPFSRELQELAGVSGGPASEADERALLTTLLDRMGYAEMPKGLIPFHRHARPQTAFRDQLEEGAAYTRATSGHSRVHFTVAGDRRADFETLLEEVREEIEGTHNCSLQVSFSEQQPSTDTIALDASGQPFRLASGELLFRPAGHGALIENLESLGGDVVVIKNIDNILPSGATSEVVRWKLVLIGVLAGLEAERDQLLAQSRVTSDVGQLQDLVGRVAAVFGRSPDRPLSDVAALQAFIASALDRPLRVCGVVRNEGEPGGAPFWVADGALSTRQIVESAQVDLTDPDQKRVFESATHFNPVDIVCSLRDGSGTAYELSRFVDPQAAFVARKTFEGRELTALERPGLWNGGMAHWNTVNVEVPGSTFAPVKTVFDLLRPQHQ